MKNLILNLMVILAMSLVLSCGNDDDDEMMSVQSCTDGIQNGNEDGVDCGGDCAPCVTTAEEDKTNVQQSFDDLTGCAMEVRDSRTTNELFRNFLNLSDGEIMNEAWIDDLTVGLESVFDFDQLEDDSKFDLAFHAGTHIYDASTVSWSKINDVADKVVLQFPSDANGTSNNVEFILDDYTDELVVIDGENMSLPKTMHAYMNIDDTKAFEITLSEITYDTNSEDQVPTNLVASLFMDPITVDIELSSASSKSYEMGMSIKNSGLCDVSINTQFQLNDDDMSEMGMGSFETAAVQVNLGQLSFRTMGDLASLIALEEPTDSQINSLVDLDVFFQNFKIADLEINDEMETILLLYKDGTSEDVNDLLKNIEDILAEFFG